MRAIWPSTSSNFPAVFSPDARQKFINLCQQDETDVVADQWVSMLTTRQLLPSRQRRTCSTSWAKRQGRMLCYSCLCVMPFACKCRERQRQRASRLKCGYLPPKKRLVVVGKANRAPKSNGSPSLFCVSKKISNQLPVSNGEEVHKMSDDKPSVSPLQAAFAEESGSIEGLKEVSPASDSNLVHEDKCDKSLLKELTPLSIVINGESDTKEAEVETELSNGSEKLINHDSHLLNADPTCKIADANPFPCKISQLNGGEKAVSVKRKKNCSSSAPNKKRKSQSLSNPTWAQARKAEEKEFSQPGVDGQAKKICNTPLSKSFPPILGLATKLKEGALSNIDNTPQYVIRNNSPLQITLLKLQSPNKAGNQLAVAIDKPSTSRFCMSPTSAQATFVHEHHRYQEAKSQEASGLGDDVKGVFTNPVLSTKSQKAINLEKRISLLKQSRSSSVNDTTPTKNPEKVNLDHTDLQPVTPKNSHVKIMKEQKQIAAKDSPATNSNCELMPIHGIQPRDIVWARAKQSAYWPGEVVEVDLQTVKVAWCGETTYNEVDVAMVEPFTMETLGNRFSPSHKDSASKKKLCLAIAEAIQMIRPPKIELNLRLNIVIANLLISKYQWNLNGVTVYRGQKKITLGNNKSTEKSSSSPDDQEIKTDEVTPES
uniref:PWWP domain-containing protein n=1 Tax=Ditylenchus dipsaci TaxID=166011 RepID=A0A915EIM4_9BILA